MACQFFDHDDDQPRSRESKEFSTATPEVELSTSFVGCTLYWKASGRQEAVYLHQLYGLDETETWFDIGQTVESFHTFRPLEAGRATKIRLVAISGDKGTVAETELAFEGQGCNEDKKAQTDFLFQEASTETGMLPEPGPNVGLVASSAVLLAAFVIMLVVVAVRHRRKLLNRNKEAIIDVQDLPDSNQEPNNRRVNHYLQAVGEETPRHHPRVESYLDSDHSLYI